MKREKRTKQTRI